MNILIDLARLSDWFKGNKLTLNVNKSNYILISNVQHAGEIQNQLQIDNEIILRNKCVKFLGITLAENLNWHDL